MAFSQVLAAEGLAPRSAASRRPLDHPCFHDLTMQMSPCIDVRAGHLPRRFHPAPGPSWLRISRSSVFTDWKFSGVISG